MQERAPPGVGGGAVGREPGNAGAAVVQEGRGFGPPELGGTGLDPHDAEPDAHRRPGDRGDLGGLQRLPDLEVGALGGFADNRGQRGS